MRPVVTAIDRVGALVLGLILLAVGAGLLLWAAVEAAGESIVLTAPWLRTAADSAWWSWATAAVGAVLVWLGMRWLLSHGPAERPREFTLTGSGRSGRLTADLGSLADAAAANLRSYPAVRSAKGSARVDRGTPSIYIDATAESADVLAEAAHAADEVAVTAAAMLGDTIPVRTHVHVDPKRPTARRVS
ncbi:MAG: alkaline shock response membrane anchor protein AmaP [Mycobacteriaceae bacterium]|nr:alkaline shock response membrane anchor protein AmaP [Mycobacteriaceae bacterium]